MNIINLERTITVYLFFINIILCYKVNSYKMQGGYKKAGSLSPLKRTAGSPLSNGRRIIMAGSP